MKITVNGGEMTAQEQQAYVDYLQDKYGRKVQELTLTVDGEFVDMAYVLEQVPFERIRRITGYLVGTMDRWNDAKRAEERDRVKHGMQQ